MHPAGLETLDTLIIAGIAATRSEAIRWAIDRFRELPDFEVIRDRARAADELRAQFAVPAGTDRTVLDPIERTISDEAGARFPGGAVDRVLLLQYGDDPEIEPGDLWVRVIPASDGPDDRERALAAFIDVHGPAVDGFVSHLAQQLCQIRILEFTFNVPVDRGGHCPRMSRGVSTKLSDYQREALGEDSFELTRLGPAGLDTVDAMIRAGLADTRGDAIRCALDRFRALPAYQRLREHVLDAGRLKTGFPAERLP
jgi:hypothetical protein